MLVLFGSGCAYFGQQPKPDPIPQRESMETGQTRPPGTWHVVAAGETLWSLARHYRVPVTDLVGANAIGDPTRLDVGKRIFVPLAPGADPQARKKLAAKRPSTIAQPDGPDLPPAGGFRWPLKPVKILRAYGAGGDLPLDGIELAGKPGQEVRAVAAGQVVFAAHDPRGWGHLAIVNHRGSWVSIYAYNAKLLVTEGQEVSQGQKLAELGQSGRASRPMLHLELRRGVRPLDPRPLLPKP